MDQSGGAPMVCSRWPAQRYTGAGGLPALPAPQFGEHLSERPVAVVTDEQSHRIDRLSAAAVHFRATVRPVGAATGRGGRVADAPRQTIHETKRERVARRA